MRPAGLARVRGAHGREDRRSTPTSARSTPSATTSSPGSGRRRRLGRLGGPPALVSQGDHALGDERQAGRHARATARRRSSRIRRAGRPVGPMRLDGEDAVTTTDGDRAVAGDGASSGSEALELGDAFDPRAAQAIVASGLHRLVVPGRRPAGSVRRMVGRGRGAAGARRRRRLDGARVRDAGPRRRRAGRFGARVPAGLRDRLFRAVVDDGALVNNAATEEGGGSPARGAIPGTTARAPPPTARGG